MKQSLSIYFATSALAGALLTLTGCQQAPAPAADAPAAAAPAPTPAPQVVVEEHRRDDDRNKPQDRDRRAPDRAHPADPPRPDHN